MPSVTYHPRAEQDLIEIGEYIADRNPVAADKVISKIYHDAEILAHHPYMGVSKTDFPAEMRCWVSGSYLILYEPTEYGVNIVRIVYGTRFLPSLFPTDNNA